MLAALRLALSATTAVADTLTPEGAVAVALRDNRDLQAAKLAIKQAEGRLAQSGLWPNPDLEMGAAQDAPFANEGEYSLSLGFKQRFPITGRLAKAKQVARVDAALASAEVRNQERLLAGGVLGRARELLVVQQKLEVNEASRQIFEKLVTVSENRFKAAEISATDVNLAKLALQTVELAKVTLLNQEDADRIDLNRLLGRDPDGQLMLTGDVNFQVDPTALTSATSNAVARRPDHQIALLAIESAASGVRLARSERWDDWTAGIEYSRDYQKFVAPVGGKLDQFLGLSVSVPLPLHNRNQGNILAARATESRRRAELAAVDLRINAEAQQASRQVIRLLAVLRTYREMSLPLAERNVASLQQSYAAGQLAIIAVIQAQQQLIELRLNYLDALDSFARAWTDWQTATATVPLALPPK